MITEKKMMEYIIYGIPYKYFYMDFDGIFSFQIVWNSLCKLSWSKIIIQSQIWHTIWEETLNKNRK